MNVYYLDSVTKLTIQIMSNKIILISDNSDLQNIANHIKCKTNNLYDFLLTFSSYLNANNPIHPKNMMLITQEKDKKKNTESDVDSYYYESDSDSWNPYTDFHVSNPKNDTLIQMTKLKQKAQKKYDIEGFDPGKLDISYHFIINVILKEIESIEKNYDNISVVPLEDDIFNIDIHFNKFDNTDLMNSLSSLEMKSIIMNIKLNHNLYPYYPPQVSFKTKLDNKLDIAIINLNYFNPDSWNPTNTLEQLVIGVHQILNDNCTLSTNINDMYPIINSLIQNILSFNSILPICLKNFDINIDFVRLNNENKSDSDAKHWASGVGFGFKGRSDWDINKFIETKKVKLQQNIKFMKSLEFNIYKNIQKSGFRNYILNSDLIEILCVFIKQLNLVELEINYQLYNHIFNIFDTIKLNEWEERPVSDLSNIAKALKIFHIEASTYIKINKDINKYTNKYKIITRSNKFYNKIKEYATSEYTITSDSKDNYCYVLKSMQFKEVCDDFTTHHYNDNSSKPTKQCIAKISKELATYHNSLPLNYNSSVFVRYDENNIQLIKALIIGPENTPYENGCFLFDIYIPDNYPAVPPKVNLQTTGYGKVRFNPNLYNSGKVCLSLLGTWSGSAQEKWNQETSTLLQVLVSIQSLILVENPYFNEPGYEKEMHTLIGKRKSFEYNDFRRKATIKWAMIETLKKTPKEFDEVINNHFKYKKEAIKNSMEKWYNETKLSKVEFNKIKNDLSNLLNKLE